MSRYYPIFPILFGFVFCLLAPKLFAADRELKTNWVQRIKAVKEQRNHRPVCAVQKAESIPIPARYELRSMGQAREDDWINIDIAYHVIYIEGDSVIVNVQVDGNYSEALWDIWDYQNNVFLNYMGGLFDSPNQSYSLGGILTPGSYALFLWDDYGDGGISGSVTTHSGQTLTSWSASSYGQHEFMDFTVAGGGYSIGLMPESVHTEQTAHLNNVYNDMGYNFEIVSVDTTNNSGWYYSTDSFLFDTDQFQCDTVYHAMTESLAVEPSHTLNYYWTGVTNTLGFAIFPWIYDEGNPHNGLFCGNYTSPGGSFPYNEGDTGVHEVGHYVGLYHVFENGCNNPGDEVDDTAYQMEPLYGCPSSNYSCGSNDPVNNFMNYVDDACMNNFSNGQIDRINWALETYRPTLIDPGTLYSGPVWHVTTTGSDSSGDGSEANPFATIQTAIDSSSDGDTVLVAAGTYMEHINFSGKNIVVGSLYLTTQDTSYISSTIIQKTLFESVVTFSNSESSDAVLSGFTILGEGLTSNVDKGGGILCDNGSPTLSNLIIRNCGAWAGGGIACINASPQINNLLVTQNWTAAGGGGGFWINDNSNPVLTNVVISNNQSNEAGSAIQIQNSNLECTNVTIADHPPDAAGYGTLYLYNGASVELINSIMYNTSSNEIYAFGSGLENTITISYSDINGGQTGIVTNDNAMISWGTGNIDADPYFCNPDSGDYTLSENSPCIGTGEDGADMGAFGLGCGQYNFPPTEFSLSGPANNTYITIDESNMNTGFISLWWDASSDANGDSLYYLMRATSAEIGDHGMDTNATSFDLSYMDIIEDMSDNNVTAASLEWTVHVTDGIDTVEADNAPFTMGIDGANALSAYLEGLLPDEFALHQNYPNPFNPVTTLRYDLPENGIVNITIYDMLGREVKTLINQAQDAGYRSVIWDATNDYGKPVSAGIYLYQIQAGEYISTKKMVLLK